MIEDWNETFLKMLKRGCLSKVTDDQVFEVLRQLPIFESNGQLKTASSNIWKIASSSLKNQKQPISLYFQVYQNRGKVLTRLRCEHQVEDPTKDESSFISQEEFEDSSQNDMDQDYIDTSFKNNSALQSLTDFRLKRISFKIVLNAKEWILIKPIIKTYRDKKNTKY